MVLHFEFYGIDRNSARTVLRIVPVYKNTLVSIFQDTRGNYLQAHLECFQNKS